MEHSLRAYLKRRTTQELDIMLHYCLEGDRWKQYEDALLEILQILRAREKEQICEVPLADPDITKGG